MKKVIYILIVLVLVVGCNQSLEYDQINTALKFCEKHGGFSRILSGPNFDIVYCYDKSQINLEDIKLIK